MAKTNVTTVSIKKSGKQRLEQAAIDLAGNIRERVSISEIVTHLVDHHLDECIQEMIATVKAKNEIKGKNQ